MTHSQHFLLNHLHDAEILKLLSVGYSSVSNLAKLSLNSRRHFLAWLFCDKDATYSDVLPVPPQLFLRTFLWQWRGFPRVWFLISFITLLLLSGSDVFISHCYISKTKSIQLCWAQPKSGNSTTCRVPHASFPAHKISCMSIPVCSDSPWDSAGWSRSPAIPLQSKMQYQVSSLMGRIRLPMKGASEMKYWQKAVTDISLQYRPTTLLFSLYG